MKALRISAITLAILTISAPLHARDRIELDDITIEVIDEVDLREMDRGAHILELPFLRQADSTKRHHKDDGHDHDRRREHGAMQDRRDRTEDERHHGEGDDRWEEDDDYDSSKRDENDRDDPRDDERDEHRDDRWEDRWDEDDDYESTREDVEEGHDEMEEMYQEYKEEDQKHDEAMDDDYDDLRNSMNDMDNNDESQNDMRDGFWGDDGHERPHTEEDD